MANVTVLLVKKNAKYYVFLILIVFCFFFFCHFWQAFKPADSLWFFSVWVQVCRSSEGYLMPTANLVNFLHSWGLDCRTTWSKERITLRLLWKNYQHARKLSFSTSKFSASKFDIHNWLLNGFALYIHT